MANKRAVVIACTSDLHCGSTVGLCPPEGVRLDDDATYHPSKAQQWIWHNWESEFWKDVREIRDDLKAELRWINNGDASDGDHHHTSQIISRNPEQQKYVWDRVSGVPSILKPEYMYLVRGTEAHVGPSGATEEAWARSLKAERNPVTRTHSWWQLRFEVYGKIFDFQHHGRMGQRPWTKGNVVGNLAAQIFYEYASRGHRHPDFAIRSHLHTYFDTYDAHPTRVIATPAWQLKNAYAHKVVPEALSDIGGIIIVVYPDGRTEVRPKIYRADLPPMWQPARKDAV
jgi:hypothetical protein